MDKVLDNIFYKFVIVEYVLVNGFFNEVILMYECILIEKFNDFVVLNNIVGVYI